MRDEVMCMMRVRNEDRWIARSLERTLAVASKVVIWDDGSTDRTKEEASRIFDELVESRTWDYKPWGAVLTGKSQYGPSELHIVLSPFRTAVNELEEVSEIRDKNILWWYVKARVKFKHVLCLDGDEMLSNALLRNFDKVIGMLEDGIDILHFPFVYLWNSETTRRVDAVYGRFEVPRMFTIARVDPFDVFEMFFEWHGHRQGRRVLGGFHCGSIPRQHFLPEGREPKASRFESPIVHFGYLYAEDRQKKFEFYNRIDPGNQFEGEYRHIIEQKNIHAPGPVEIVEWRDE